MEFKKFMALLLVFALSVSFAQDILVSNETNGGQVVGQATPSEVGVFEPPSPELFPVEGNSEPGQLVADGSQALNIAEGNGELVLDASGNMILIENQPVVLSSLPENKLLVSYQDASGEKREVEILSTDSNPVLISLDSQATLLTSLEIKENHLYLLENNVSYEIKQMPEAVQFAVLKSEPQLITSTELLIENNQPVYRIKGFQKVELSPSKEIQVSLTTIISADSGNEINSSSEVVLIENGKQLKEAENELFLVMDSELIVLKEVDEEYKSKIRRKLTSDSLKPTVELKKIQELKNIPELRSEEKYRLMLQLLKNSPELKELPILKTVETDEYDFVVVELTLLELNELLESERLLKAADEKEFAVFREYANQVLQAEAENKIRILQLKKTSSDALHPSEGQKFLLGEGWEPQEGQSSPYQRFVTPDADEIVSSVSGLDSENIYELIRGYAWISDSDLHGEVEKWLLPSQFLIDTPAYSTNPFYGTPVSDCSEQANTLVSLLRASGVPPEDVRVVLGTVNFSGSVGGHAWVEIKQGGNWLVLEPTSGPYYDQEDKEVVSRQGTGYNYWAYHPYPIVEVWTYYNDVYFTDERSEVAEGWSQLYSPSFDDALNDAMMEEGGAQFYHNPWNLLLLGLILFAGAMLIYLNLPKK